MYAYATADEVELGYKELSESEKITASALLGECADIIDAFAPNADPVVKRTVSCRMVRRALDAANSQIYPVGATQGSMSAMGYTQSWQLSGGTGAGSGELYLSSLEKRMLGVGNRIGFSNPYGGDCRD